MVNDDITMAQVKAGEDAVVERLRRKGLIPPAELHIPADKDAKLAALEHSLATNFVTLQKTNIPTERQRIWAECLRLAGELEKLTNE